jgi:glycosyltransferase involved in cell wall biosynthesis
MLLLDATHTSHTRAQTGIQRVTRALFTELGANGGVAAVCHDPYLRGWRSLDRAETDNLRPRELAGASRGAKWPLTRKIASHAARLAGRRFALPGNTGLVCPELFSARVGASYAELFAKAHGPRVALFNDAIALRFPELTPPSTVARMPAYLRELLQFDGVAAISEDSATALRDYWRWLGIAKTPPVLGIPLGVDPVDAAAADAPQSEGPPTLLYISTVEGRKNHLALLEACESLWREGLSFQLELIGLARPDTAASALRRIEELRAGGRPLRYHGVAPSAEVAAAFRRCAFTVYPSLAEGFGLPVLESLSHGKPCICSKDGALGEAARGGGCLTVDRVDAPALAAVIRALLSEPERLTKLTVEARRRPIRAWRDYTADLLAWMKTLPRKSAPPFAVAMQRADA